jgi:hypothetical protein
MSHRPRRRPSSLWSRMLARHKDVVLLLAGTLLGAFVTSLTQIQQDRHAENRATRERRIAAAQAIFDSLTYLTHELAYRGEQTAASGADGSSDEEFEARLTAFDSSILHWRLREGRHRAMLVTYFGGDAGEAFDFSAGFHGQTARVLHEMRRFRKELARFRSSPVVTDALQDSVARARHRLNTLSANYAYGQKLFREQESEIHTYWARLLFDETPAYQPTERERRINQVR